jgi:GntR family transcriptional regulator
VRAVVPTEAERELLGVGTGVAAFMIDRLGCAGERSVEWRQTLVRADRFSVTARFSAREGYRMDGSV